MMRHFALGIIASLLMTAAAPAAPRTIQIPVDGQRAIAFDQPVAKLYIKNPDVVDAKADDKQHVTLLGRSTGATLIQTFAADGSKLSDYRIVVGDASNRKRSTAQIEATTVTLQRGKDRVVYICGQNRCFETERLGAQTAAATVPTAAQPATPPPEKSSGK